MTAANIAASHRIAFAPHIFTNHHGASPGTSRSIAASTERFLCRRCFARVGSRALVRTSLLLWRAIRQPARRFIAIRKHADPATNMLSLRKGTITLKRRSRFVRNSLSLVAASPGNNLGSPPSTLRQTISHSQHALVICDLRTRNAFSRTAKLTPTYP